MDEIIEIPRMTVEDLMETYTRDELLKVMRYQLINNVPVLAQQDISMILSLDPEDPSLQWPEKKEETDEPEVR
jgi:hypothetical protein